MEELSHEIIKDKEYFDISAGGVTASGGEAMLNAEFVCKFFAEMKRRGIRTALDTTGFCDKDKLFEVLKYTDIILYDLKVISSEKHKRFTGVDNGVILENAVMIAELIRGGSTLKLWIRTPIIPGFTDNNKTIADIADFIKSNLYGAVERWELCAFNNSCTHKYKKLGKQWEFADVGLISKENMRQLKIIAEKSGAYEIVCSGITTK
ncbi:MAG: radical SAM protein [Clostridia bacterium]|nr:radical SAM protein [Clostridia bacterium]